MITVIAKMTVKPGKKAEKTSIELYQSEEITV